MGNVPSGLTKLNKRGIPSVGFITSGMVTSFDSGLVTVAAQRRQLPNQKRPCRSPGGDIMSFLGFLRANLIVYWTGWGTNWKLFLAVASDTPCCGPELRIRRP